MGAFHIDKCEIYKLRPHDNLDEWDKFVDDSPQGCIYCKSWWLRAVCTDGFKIIMLKSGDEVIAGIPITFHQNTDTVKMPLLTQTLGILFKKFENQKYESRLAKEMKIVDALIKPLHSLTKFSMNFHYSFKNWLPFYWNGYNETTRYTYILHDLKNMKRAVSRFNYKTRTAIKKAEKNGIVLSETEDIDKFLYYNQLTFERQGIGMPYTKAFVHRLDEACKLHDARTIFLAKDLDGRIHAGLYLLHDSNYVYCAMLGSDPTLRKSKAGIYLLWNGILLAHKENKKLNFVGSMMQNVEQVFRDFGAVQVPYFAISKEIKISYLSLFRNRFFSLLGKD